jgi:predicted nucleic acid-binding protein
MGFTFNVGGIDIARCRIDGNLTRNEQKSIGPYRLVVWTNGCRCIVCIDDLFDHVDFILNKYESEDSVRAKLRKFKIICEVGEVNEETIDKGLNSAFKDFEDAVQYYSALQANCSVIITRNAKDFKHSSIPVMTAEEYLKR